MGTTKRRAAVLILALLALAPVASAHWADLAVAEVATAEREVRMTLTFPTGLAGYADDDRDGSLSAAEVARHRAALRAELGRRVRVVGGGRPGALEVAPTVGEVKLPSGVTVRTHSSLVLTYRWPQAVRGLVLRYDLFVPGVSTASLLATVLHDGEVRSVVFTPESREYVLDGQTANAGFGGFVALGVEHILSGYDHLLFLLVLLALGGGLRQLLKVVTAFTLAHSVTLALAVLGVVSLPSRVIESGIALSIVYVAAENLLRRDSGALRRQRWVVTFAFGLLHGLGFAGILSEMSIPRENLAGALVGFNLGVELGQLAVVAPAFLALALLERRRLGGGVRRAASAFGVAAGLFWFAQRALSAA